MSDKIIFRAVAGGLKGEEFLFEEKGLCMIGRSSDSTLIIPREKDMRISRRHCLLILDPPNIRIRDLGSRNGTYVNNQIIEGGALGTIPEERTPVDHDLKHGDKVAMGETIFEVIIPSQAFVQPKRINTKSGAIQLQKPATEAAKPAAAQPPPMGAPSIPVAQPAGGAIKPPETKVVKVAQPDMSLPGMFLPKIAQVNVNSLKAPSAIPRPGVPTSTTPMTESFTKPDSLEGETLAAKNKSDISGNASQKSGFDPGATLILKAKPTADPVAQQPAASAPRVLKAKVVTKASGVTPTPLAPKQSSPAKARVVLGGKKKPTHDLTEVMDVNELEDDIKLSAEYRRKENKKKRVTTFRVKTPKR